GQPGPADVAGRLEGARPVRQEPGRDRLDAPRRNDPDGRLGQDAGPALRPEGELAEVGPGRRGRVWRQLERAGRRLESAAGEQVLDPPEPDRLLAGRASRHPAAEGRALPRL